MIKATFDLENKLAEEGYEYIIGIDEAGRGPLAGPVVAAAALVKNNEFRIKNQEFKDLEIIRDSKTLSEKQREKLFGFIHEHFFVGVGQCDHQTIDRMNILEASFLAMKKALASLFQKCGPEKKKNKFIVLLDGGKPIPHFSFEQRAVANGDKYIKSISAASIIAKVTRDRIMREMHKIYPLYAFDQHKGYGTRLHMELLKAFGPSEIHRQSFEPIKSIVKRKKK